MTDIFEQDGEELHVDPSAEPNPNEPILGAEDLPDTVADGDIEVDHGPGDEPEEDPDGDEG